VGRVKVEKDSETIEYSTSGGVFEVKNNKAIVLADSIETKEEIDIERAKLSKIRAEEILKIENSSVNEKEEAKFAIQKAENRIKVIENK
jgi:F-type H+-transporting ATPase subunit epsilon